MKVMGLPHPGQEESLLRVPAHCARAFFGWPVTKKMLIIPAMQNSLPPILNLFMNSFGETWYFKSPLTLHVNALSAPRITTRKVETCVRSLDQDVKIDRSSQRKLSHKAKRNAAFLVLFKYAHLIDG